ncbi:hypothetical protein L1887_56143 [Cichorium endivia]|nr:hypothetical protein L1887_56143 [Cichorium endivia]
MPSTVSTWQPCTATSGSRHALTDFACATSALAAAKLGAGESLAADELEKREVEVVAPGRRELEARIVDGEDELGRLCELRRQLEAVYALGCADRHGHDRRDEGGPSWSNWLELLLEALDLPPHAAAAAAVAGKPISAAQKGTPNGNWIRRSPAALLPRSRLFVRFGQLRARAHLNGRQRRTQRRKRWGPRLAWLPISVLALGD